VDRLLFISRWELTPKQQEVTDPAVVEAQEGEVEVEPPGRVLLAKNIRQLRRHDDKTTAKLEVHRSPFL
jgi:hypothetical protein